jgi:hypothetical protein
MAMPTEAAWTAAVHMMNYMYQNRHRGIKFSGNGNGEPIAFVDASNKPDPNDSKCQYGYVHMWCNGPIVAVSKKLAHVGLSAAHNEYMALHFVNRHTIWLRQLLTELGLEDVVAKPTLTYCDNRAALTLAEEDIVTTGNQYTRTPYHFNKEVIQDGNVFVEWIASAENLADLMTKSVPRQVIEYLLGRLLGYETNQQ